MVCRETPMFRKKEYYGNKQKEHSLFGTDKI